MSEPVTPPAAKPVYAAPGQPVVEERRPYRVTVASDNGTVADHGDDLDFATESEAESVSDRLRELSDHLRHLGVDHNGHNIEVVNRDDESKE